MAVYGSAKSNVMAVVKEVTAGTPVDPSAGTDFVALQADLTLAPNFEHLANEEIRASIGMAKGIQGLEQPNGSFSHYLKGSGTEGTAPEINDLLEAAFGTTSTNSTQRTTTTGSAVGVVNLAAGGSDFARGKAILVKDATNGYSIRPVDSVSTNALTLGFNLLFAPLTGIGVGKCINFAPANSGHPTLSIHSYRANGQAYELLAGALVSELSISATAGQLIKGSFSFEGTKYHFDPIRITSSFISIDFLAGVTDYNVSIPVKVYRDPYELAQAIQDAMNGSGAADVFTVSYNLASNNGKFTIASNGSTLTMKWNTGTNTATTIATKIGFSAGANSSGALTYTSATAQSWVAPYTPSFDSADPVAAKNLEILLGGATDSACFCAQEVTIKLSNTLTNVLCICAESGVDQKKVTARKVEITFKALLDKHEADKFKRYRSNADTKFAFNFGPKSGGNWVAGQCGNIYVPSCSVTKFSVVDLDTLVGIDMSLEGFVDSSGNGEVYLNFL